MILRLNFILVLSVVLASQGVWAQAPNESEDGVPSAPPLVPAGAPEVPFEPVSLDPNEPVERVVERPQPGPLTAAPPAELSFQRVGLSLLAGAAAGSVVAIGGGFLGGALAPEPRLAPIGNSWALASVGFALGAPVGVLVVSRLLGGRGALWATIVGDIVGLALGALASVFGGTAAVPLLFALPLGGSVLGFEVTGASGAP